MKNLTLIFSAKTWKMFIKDEKSQFYKVFTEDQIDAAKDSEVGFIGTYGKIDCHIYKLF